MSTATSNAATGTDLCQSQPLAVADIHASPTNPRKTFPEDAHAEMVKSVRRHGVMQPILVRPWPESYHFEGEHPKYELVAGERRYRAARDAGISFVPGLVRNLSDDETIELQIVENLHRKDLNELEEAEGYELAMKRFKFSAEQLAEKIDKSKAYIYGRLKLTAACEAARQAFRDGQLDASRLLLIARIPTTKLQEQALKEITQWEYLGTYRAAANHVQNRYMLRLADAPFSRADADLVPSAGKCYPCPKRTGSNPELYPDVKSADICTDPECFAAKKGAHFTYLKAEAKAQGQAVIEGAAAKRLMPYAHMDIKGFVKLEDKCYGVQDEKGKTPTYRDLLGDASLPVTLIETPDGGLVELVEQKAFQAATAAAGIKTPAPAKDEAKEREAKAKEETEFRRRLHGQIRQSFLTDVLDHGAELNEDDMRLVARQFLAATWHENQKRLAALYVHTEEKLDDHARIRRMTEELDSMKPAELCLFLIDLSLIGMTHVGPYQLTDTPKPLLNTAVRMGISAPAVRAGMWAEKKAKEKQGKTKGASTPKPSAKPISTPSKLAPAEERERAAKDGAVKKGAKARSLEAKSVPASKKAALKKDGQPKPLVEKNTKTMAAEGPQRCTRTLELPGLDIEMNATPITLAAPALSQSNQVTQP